MVVADRLRFTLFYSMRLRVITFLQGGRGQFTAFPG
jgi:hypothetical protein